MIDWLISRNALTSGFPGNSGLVPMRRDNFVSDE